MSLNDFKDKLILGGGADYASWMQHPVLQKHFEIIKMLAETHLFVVYYDEEKLWLEECCDNHYRYALTKVECQELSQLFAELAHTLEEGGQIIE